MIYHFDDVTVDTETRQVNRDGAKVHLTPKAFELLKVLLENRARAVSKSELQQSLWPSVFVEETNIAGLVGEIRGALGDDAANPRYVGTVYGFGYRFVGDTFIPAQLRSGRISLMLQQREIPLMEGANVIGRAPDAAIQIDAPSISRYHARIVVTRGEASLEDAGSKNGTRLNGAPITSATLLADGDEIRLGSIVLTVRTASTFLPTLTIPPEA